MKLSEIQKSTELTCALPYVAIGRMLEMIKETGEEERERAIIFCGDGQELSFPESVGEPPKNMVVSVRMPECPADKEYVGYFHTHPAGITEKSPSDWHADMASRSSVSCVGATEELDKELIHRRAIACHRYNKDHPEYEHFRKGFMVLSNLVAGYIRQLNRKPGPITEDESKTALRYARILDSAVDEGIEKGIISSCAKFSIPDVESMLEEQK